jgi:hypothetical protein
MGRLFAVLLLAMWAQAQSTESPLPEEVPHNIYVDDLAKCRDCVTYTIVITDDRAQSKVARNFKDIADSFGRKHAGAVVSWSEALKQYRFFSAHKCGSFTDLASKVVVYIDTRSGYCGRFPYEDEPRLVAVLSIITANLDEARTITNEGWRLKTKQAITAYARSNKLVEPLRDAALELVDYVGEMLLGYRR